MKKRTIVMYCLFGAMMCGLIFRIYSLNTGKLQNAADTQNSVQVTVANARGTIYDTNLQPMTNAVSEPTYSISPSPEALAAISSQLTKEQIQLISQKAQINKPAIISTSAILPVSPDVTPFLVPSRTKGGLLAPHVIGYLDSDQLHGVSGIEKAYDELLTKCSGKATVRYRVAGNMQLMTGVAPTVTNTLNNAKGGVVLTLDKSIQRTAEDVARQYLTKGAVVILDPSTSRILAMVSLPDFQPGTVADCLDNKDSPLMNRAISNYNLGSVFKIVSTAAALEAGIPTSETYTCTGSYKLGETVFHCHNRLGHGPLNMTQAFCESCNTYYIHLMLKAGKQPMYQMAASMGFDRPLYLCDGIQTARAVMPSLEQLSQGGALANMSFGQGDLLASPVHVAQMVQAVLNGGEMIQPTLVRGTVDAAGKVTEQAAQPPTTVFSAPTADIIKDMMIQTVEKGSGTLAKPDSGGAGGKTGTAETGLLGGDGNTVVQSWFTGFFPADKPQYIVTVLSEDTNTSGVRASSVFKALADALNKSTDD